MAKDHDELVRRSIFFVAIALSFVMSNTLRAQEASLVEDFPYIWSARLEQRMDQILTSLSQEGVATPLQKRNEPEDKHSTTVLSQTLQGRAFGVPAMKAILLNEGLPAQLVSIVAVESNFDSGAVSSKGAAGLWQLMPDTARRFGLIVNQERDERFDPLRSTLAAASYLRTLHDEFHDWPLVFAAYNAGERRLEHALDKAQGARFWELPVQSGLPAETRNYVRAVLVHIGDENVFAENYSFPRSDPRSEMTRDMLRVNQSQNTGYIVFAQIDTNH
jgi:membrane-bound lytic murein transglycosylase D